jgi:acyl carrier protein
MSPTFTTDQIEEAVSAALVDFGTPSEVIAPDALLASLDIDSLDLAELAQIVEEKFGVVLNGSDLKQIATVADLVHTIAARA